MVIETDYFKALDDYEDPPEIGMLMRTTLSVLALYVLAHRNASHHLANIGTAKSVVASINTVKFTKAGSADQVVATEAVANQILGVSKWLESKDVKPNKSGYQGSGDRKKIDYAMKLFTMGPPADGADKITMVAGI